MIKDIAGNQNGVDVAVAHDRHDLIKHAGLLALAGEAFQGLAKVPVSCVEDAHNLPLACPARAHADTTQRRTGDIDAWLSALFAQ